MSKEEPVRTVDLSHDIVNRVQERVQYTDFETEAEYIEYVLEEVLYHVEQENDLSGAKKVNEHQVQNRLKSLGYLNE